MPIFSPEQTAEIEAICRNVIAGGFQPSGNPDIIFGPDEFGGVIYRSAPKFIVFDPQLLRDKKIPLNPQQIANIAQNSGTDNDGNLGAMGPAVGRLIPNKLPECRVPPSREQTLGLLGLCHRYHWDDARQAWVQYGDVLLTHTAFRTPTTALGLKCLEGK